MKFKLMVLQNLVIGGIIVYVFTPVGNQCYRILLMPCLGLLCSLKLWCILLIPKGSYILKLITMVSFSILQTGVISN